MPKIGTLRDLKSLPLDEAVIVSPSDTTYGFHSRSLRRLQELKSRTGPFIYLVSSLAMTEALCSISADDKAALQKYWPGPITFILKSKTDPKETVAVRLPKDPFCIEIIKAFEGPVLSTSCNLANESTVETLEEAISIFGDRVDLYIDGGRTSGARPSTLVNLTVSPPQVLRQGAITFNLEKAK